MVVQIQCVVLDYITKLNTATIIKYIFFSKNVCENMLSKDKFT